jgi:hypothetical protein
MSSICNLSVSCLVSVSCLSLACVLIFLTHRKAQVRGQRLSSRPKCASLPNVRVRVRVGVGVGVGLRLRG